VPATHHDPAQTLASEIELATSRTQPEFDGCYTGVGGARAIHGSITIAFRVLTDGRVANIAAVENKTESVELAACLVAAIARWSFASRPTSPASFSRTFTYR
jgi:outer membrane biosynthesis protein TonB